MDKKKVKIIGGVFLVCIVIAVLLFFSVKENKVDDRPVIAVTIMPEIEFVKAVAGEEYNVITMIPSGASPENYEPTPMERANFEKAKIYFSMGVPTEENNILPNISEDTQLVKLNEEVSNRYEELTFENGSRDPHIWLSPKRVSAMLNVIADELTALNPENEAIYQENANNYIEKLEAVSTEINDILSQKANKKIIVYHPAFAYLADEFGIEMYALEEEGKEATAESLKEKIDLAKKEGIKYIFYQAEVDSSQSKAFAEEIGGQTMKLEPLSQNYIENLKKMAELLAK